MHLPPQTPFPGVTRAAPYDTRPPSPPTIDIPATRTMGRNSVTLIPSPRNLDPALFDLDSDYKQIITSGLRTQEAIDQASNWEYSARRSAQVVVEDSIYLGPLSVVRDKAWMESQGVTMVVVVRDRIVGLTGLMGGLKLGGQGQGQGQGSPVQQQKLQKKEGEVPVPRPAPTLGPAAKKVCEELGVQVEAIAVSGLQELIREFPKLNEKIVRHLISVHMRTSGAQEGKVLVCCETGNDRSAAVVVAYLVEVWGADLITALRFVLYRRFCVACDDNTRRYLKNYEDILEAKRMRWQGQGANGKSAGNGGVAAADERKTPSKLKRQLAAEGDHDDEEDRKDGEGDYQMQDHNNANSPGTRWSEEAAQKARGRHFAPFLERSSHDAEGGRSNGAGSRQS